MRISFFIFAAISTCFLVGPVCAAAPEKTSDATCGQVTGISVDKKNNTATITLAVGTKKMPPAPGEQRTAASADTTAAAGDSANSAFSEKPSLIDLSGDTLSITVSLDSVVVPDGMPGPGNMMDRRMDRSKQNRGRGMSRMNQMPMLSVTKIGIDDIVTVYYATDAKTVTKLSVMPDMVEGPDFDNAPGPDNDRKEIGPDTNRRDEGPLMDR